MQEKSETNVTFSQELEKLLKSKDMSAMDLARALEISHVAVGNYLKGRIPHSAILSQIAVYFGVSVERLLHGSYQENPDQGFVVHDARAAERANLISEIEEADPEAGRSVDQHLRTVHRIVTGRKETLQGVNSKVADAARAGAAGALRAARRVPPESSRSPGAGEPSVRKRPPGGGGRKGSKDKPGPQGQAQG